MAGNNSPGFAVMIMDMSPAQSDYEAATVCSITRAAIVEPRRRRPRADWRMAWVKGVVNGGTHVGFILQASPTAF